MTCAPLWETVMHISSLLVSFYPSNRFISIWLSRNTHLGLKNKKLINDYINKSHDQLGCNCKFYSLQKSWRRALLSNSSSSICRSLHSLSLSLSLSLSRFMRIRDGNRHAATTAPFYFMRAIGSERHVLDPYSNEGCLRPGFIGAGFIEACWYEQFVPAITNQDLTLELQTGKIILTVNAIRITKNLNFTIDDSSTINMFYAKSWTFPCSSSSNAEVG